MSLLVESCWLQKEKANSTLSNKVLSTCRIIASVTRSCLDVSIIQFLNRFIFLASTNLLRYGYSSISFWILIIASGHFAIQMETPTPSFENTLPSPSTSRNGIQSRLFNNSSSLYTSHTPQAGSSFHTPIRHTLKRLHASTFHNSPGLKHRAPRLIPLISKFEALDAESLRFSVRDAQPPHLRLTRTRMSWQNINDMKATREKLLGLFERPGWGATTLRGLQDTSRRDVNRIFNEVSHENEKGPSRTTRYEAIYQSMSPSDINSNSGQGWLPNASPGDGRENRIQERIKVFDRGMKSQPVILTRFEN